MTEYVSSRDRAKRFRVLLKKTYPGTKFSVRCDTGTAWNWITVKWTDGPAEAEMQDLLRPMHPDLELLREYSDETQRAAAQLLKDHHPEIEVFTADGLINWGTETQSHDIIIGSKPVRNHTMHAAIKSISDIYVLRGEKAFPNAEEQAKRQAEFLVERLKTFEQQQAELEALDSDDENLPQHEAGEDAQDAEEARGRLTRGNPFVLGMHAGEKAHLEVRKVSPFEAILTAVPDPEAVEDGELTPRNVTSLTPFNRPLTVFCVPALVMADTDGFQAGELVWISKTISTVLDEVDRVLVSRGDNCPLQPVTTDFLILV